MESGTKASLEMNRLRWKDKTAEERSAHGRMMVEERWRKWREKKAAQRKVRKRRRGGIK